MSSLKLREIGNSVGVIFPKDVLEKLGATVGDEISYVLKSQGVLELCVNDKDVDDLMAMAEEIMDENRTVLRALAK
ncbi:MAG: AbrB/MazE/SpoVT family DNA-binding domain-containing protein [Pseudomonadota bacterium]